MRVLVTGGAGYIGSVVTEVLRAAGDEVVVVDNLCTGHRGAVPEDVPFIELDLRDGAALRAVLRDHRIEAVVHMAAISLVGESMQQPGAYYHNNVVGGLSLLDAMVASGVKKLVFSSTASVYGEPVRVPILEDDPTIPTSTYGGTKLAIEHMLQWYDRAHGLRYTSLRYFNAAGASAAHGEDHRPESHLIPRLLHAAMGRPVAPPLAIFGTDYPTRDGTAVRDYIHVLDLAEAHRLALHHASDQSHIFNLGSGTGYTVREVLDAARAVTGAALDIPFGPRRAGDPAVLIASSDRIRAVLGWRPQREDLREIVGSAWAWYQRFPNGYPG